MSSAGHIAPDGFWGKLYALTYWGMIVGSLLTLPTIAFVLIVAR
jgi:hypothetical protein